MSRVMTLSEIESFIEDNISDDLLALSDKKLISDRLKESARLRMKSSKDDIRSVYTSRDIQNVRKYLIEKVKELTDEWTDFNESDAGMVLIELISGLGDMLGFYLDKQSLECYIGSVKQRKNAAGILSLIGYHMHMTNSCITTCRFTLSRPLDHDVEIPEYTQLLARHDGYPDIYYSTIESKVIIAGDTQVDVVCKQGEVHKSYVSVGDLKSNQVISILAKDIAEDSMTLSINGEKWYRYEDILLLGDTDIKGFTVYEDKLCNPYVIFHNSYKKYLPQDNSIKAEFTYLTSIGEDGKVKAGLINNISSNIYDSEGSNVTSLVSVVNLDDATGGAPRETVDHARSVAPKKLSTLGKAIVLKDYEYIANSVPGVFKSLAVDWSVSHSKYTQLPYHVILYIVPVGGGVASDTFLSKISSLYTDKMPSSMTLSVKSADYVKFDIKLKIYALSDETTYDDLKKKIEHKLRDVFSVDKLDFGQRIQSSNISTVIESNFTQVDYTSVDTKIDSIKMDLSNFPVLGDISIIVESSSSRKISRSDVIV